MAETRTPLEALTRQIRAKCVPSLHALLITLEGVEDYPAFVALVNTFLPDRRDTILSQPSPSEQIVEFATHFTERYFPLDDSVATGEVEEYGELVRFIPMVLLGLSFDDYHNIYFERPGMQLLTLLVANPWAEWADERVALAESCAEHVPQELVDRAQRVTLTPELAHELLDGTSLEPLALFASWIHQCTGNFFLDTSYQEVFEQGAFVDWSEENVQELTRQWPQAVQCSSTINNFIDWLEQDLNRFEEIVRTLERRMARE